MFRPLEELAAVVDRQRLLDYLRDLEDICDDMISDKGEIAKMLYRKPIVRDDLPGLLTRLDANVKITQTRVKRVRSVLREEFSAKGQDVSDELSDNLRSRKSWVEELRASIPVDTDDQLSSLFASRATESKNALKAANMKLSELVQFLSRHSTMP